MTRRHCRDTEDQRRVVADCLDVAVAVIEVVAAAVDAVAAHSLLDSIVDAFDGDATATPANDAVVAAGGGDGTLSAAGG